MSRDKPPITDATELLEKFCEGELAPEEAADLERLICSDPEVCRLYIKYVDLHVELFHRYHVDKAGGFSKIKDGPEFMAPMPDTLDGGAIETLGRGNLESNAPDISFPIIIKTSSTSPPEPFVGSPVFSFMVASVFVCLMLLGFWVYKLPSDRGSLITTNKNSQGLTDPGESPHARPAPVFVGRVTGIAGAKWSDDPNYIVPIGIRVALGRQYKLKSGLLEITYDSGAKVILEGPCSYKVDSTAGGYLALGKLVARVGVGGEGRGTGEVASGQWPAASVQGSGSASLATRHTPLATNASPLFTVRTPTAVVTDLGTEFGVEVDRAGICRAEVFQGKIELRYMSSTGGTAKMLLSVGESARVQSGQDGKATPCQKATLSGKFAREMPKWTTIDMFNTGVGLSEGQPDPHWTIIACSDDPEFEPRPAVVTAVPPDDRWLTNHSQQSQWISTGNGPPSVAAGIYTFRTTFELRGVLLESVVLRGSFLADNHVKAIRLNGNPISVPEHGEDVPFTSFSRFLAKQGFIQGVNVLEIDVFNGAVLSTARLGAADPMGLRVELRATAMTQPRRYDVAETTDLDSEGGPQL